MILGEKVSMNGDQRRSTDANIRKVIGSYDDFILTALSSQIKNSVFIEKTQKEKKTLLAQFMGLEIFDKLWVAASEEIKDVAAVLKKLLNKNDWERELAVDIKEQKIQFKEVLTELLIERKEIQNKKKSTEKNIITLTKKLKPTDKSVEDIDNLKDSKNTLTETLNSIDNELGEVSTRIEKTKLLDNELRMKIQNHKEEKLKKKLLN